MPERVQIVVPGDNPTQIAGSPHLQRLAPYGDVTLFEDTPQSADEKIARAEGAQVIINTRGVVTWREEMRRLPALEMIATCSIGTDMIDLAIAKERGIVVSNQPGRTAPVVAEHMFGLMFALSKRAYFQTAELKAGRWTRKMNTMLQGKVLGVVGTGPIGAEMARLGRAIGMEVIAWTFHPSPERAAEYGVRFVELDEAVADSRCGQPAREVDRGHPALARGARVWPDEGGGPVVERRTRRRAGHQCLARGPVGPGIWAGPG